MNNPWHPALSSTAAGKRRGKTSWVYTASLCLLLAGGTSLRAQVSPEEHAKHHPGAGGPGQAANATNAPSPGGMMGGGMGGPGGMGGMMEKMGAPKPKELYPTLMSLPDLPMEKRAEVQQQAHQRMQSGTALMAEGLEALSKAAPGDDFAAMQAAVVQLREGLAQFDSGLAAHRALAEGKAPRRVALQWFKREMNLLPAGATGSPTRAWGGPRFHLVVIALLGLFVAAMIWMYFLKMRRASALLKTLAGSGVAVAAVSARPAVGEEPAPAASTRPSPAPEAGASAVPASSTTEAVQPAAPATPPKFPAMISATQPAEKWSGQLRIGRIFSETPDVKTFRFVNEDGGPIPFIYYPGQFLTLTLSLDGKPVRRSYTIASTPTQRHYCEITVKREEQGLVSRHLHDQCHEGDLLEVSAPNGKFTFTGAEAGSIVLIGGGVGITPMMSVIRYLTDIGWGKDIYLVYCCRTTRDFIFRGDLERLQERHPNLHVFATMTRAAGTVWMGLKGRFTRDLLGHLIPDVATRRIHVCGPPPMMAAVLDMLKALQVPDDQVKTEAFGPAKKPGAPPVAVEAKTAPSAAAVTATFKQSGKTAPLLPDQTILDAAEAVGVDIENSCRAGQCGLCKVKLLAGTVTMDCEDALSADEKQQGLILACQAMAGENIEVDA